MDRLYVQHEFSYITCGCIPVTGQLQAIVILTTPPLLTPSPTSSHYPTCTSVTPSHHPPPPTLTPPPHSINDAPTTSPPTSSHYPTSVTLSHHPLIYPMPHLSLPPPHSLHPTHSTPSFHPPPTLSPTGQMVLFTSPDDMVIGRSCQVHQREITSRQAARELRTTENLINTALNFRTEKVDLSRFVN